MVLAEEEPAHDDVAEQRERLIEGLRAYGGHFTELSRLFADWLGLHSTDAVALLEVAAAEERGTPLSPARLSERILLSPSATTALLNRLEQAGHIIRSREHTDRRVITLRSSAYVQERADEFFRPLGVRLDAVMAGHPPELLAAFETLLAELGTSMDAYITERSEGRREGGPGSPSGG
ncbi:MarR family winged helix-turn-helix transcriptional regulator [Streptomyces sp. 058-1L]|uniref:MarR family winged helix-turn-helix transcriptional regulator n=1 Tax=Streptomyces sp. 058-1L TaxID=2789266 RepID=UPI0039812906